MEPQHFAQRIQDYRLTFSYERLLTYSLNELARENGVCVIYPVTEELDNFEKGYFLICEGAFNFVFRLPPYKKEGVFIDWEGRTFPYDMGIKQAGVAIDIRSDDEFHVQLAPPDALDFAPFSFNFERLKFGGFAIDKKYLTSKY